MQRSKKVIASIVVATAAVTMMAACSSGSSGGGGTSGGKTLTIGLILPLTGGQNLVAKEMQELANDFVKKTNAAGGVGDNTLAVKVYDDQNSPDQAATLAQRAVSVDNVVALTGAQGSPESLAIKEVAERNKVVYASPATASPDFAKDNTYAYRFNGTGTQIGALPGQIVKQLGLKSVSILYDNGPVGQALGALDAAGLKAAGIALAGTSISYPLNGTDMSSVVSAAKAQKPDAVIITGSAGADSGLILKTMVEQGLNVPAIGGSGGQLGLPDSISVGGSAYASLPGTYFGQNTDRSKKSFVDFSDAFQKAHNATPNETLAQLQDVFTAFSKALVKTKGVGGDKLVKAMNALDFEGVAAKKGVNVKFSADNHDAYSGKIYTIYQVKNGKVTLSKVQLSD
jgi:branched-chain amino acid transport system substrate-binding protein